MLIVSAILISVEFLAVFVALQLLAKCATSLIHVGFYYLVTKNFYRLLQCGEIFITRTDHLIGVPIIVLA